MKRLSVVLTILFLSSFLTACQSSTALHRAAKKGDLLKVKQLIEAGMDVTGKSKTGMTPLHYAAKFGHADVAKNLILQNADINTQCGKGWTALHYAAQKGHAEMVEFLMTKRARVDIKGYEKEYTPLDVATNEKNTEIVKLLHYQSRRP